MNPKKKIKAVPTQDAYNSHNNSKCLNVALIIASKLSEWRNPPKSVVIRGVIISGGKSPRQTSEKGKWEKVLGGNR